LINVAATSLEVFFLRGPDGTLTTVDLWIMAGINLPLALVSIIMFGNGVKDRVGVVPARPVPPVISGIPTAEVK
jgi:hypothetical protein